MMQKVCIFVRGCLLFLHSPLQDGIEECGKHLHFGPCPSTSLPGNSKQPIPTRLAYLQGKVPVLPIYATPFPSPSPLIFNSPLTNRYSNKSVIREESSCRWSSSLLVRGLATAGAETREVGPVDTSEGPKKDSELYTWSE